MIVSINCAVEIGERLANELREDLALKAALASWQRDRAVEAEQSRAEDELEALEEGASRERLEALELGNRLLFDRRGATEMYGSREYGSNQPKITTWFRSQMFAIWAWARSCLGLSLGGKLLSPSGLDLLKCLLVEGRHPTPVGLVDALLEGSPKVGELPLMKLLLLLQEPQALSDDLARGVIHAALDLAADVLLKFGGQ